MSFLYFIRHRFSAFSVALFLMGSLAQAALPTEPTSRIRLDHESFSYFYSPSVERPSFFSAFGADISDFTQGKALEAGAELKVLGFVRPRPTYFIEAPQAFLATSSANGPIQVAVGRKLKGWNNLDQRWNLGIWQPRFRWDYFKPEQVGLTGGFLTINEPGFELTLFASPLFIPDRGVPVREWDGGIVSDSPQWFYPPPRQFALFGTNTPIRYSLKVPSISDVVMHWSAGALVSVGVKSRPIPSSQAVHMGEVALKSEAEQTGFWASAAYAYQPMNQLLLSYDGTLMLDASPIYGDVAIYPRVLYHHLVSLEGGYQTAFTDFSLSALADAPLRDSTPANWTNQEVSKSLALSPSVDFKFNRGRTRISLSYIHVLGGYAADTGPQAVQGDSVFESRYPFTSALKSEFLSTLPGAWGEWARHLVMVSSLTADIAHSGVMWTTDLSYQAARGFLLNLGADFLGSDSRSDSGDFIGRYRANDRMRAGVAYEF